jgi:hypothetical protein
MAWKKRPGISTPWKIVFHAVENWMDTGRGMQQLASRQERNDAKARAEVWEIWVWSWERFEPKKWSGRREFSP